jgi:hypothetical protein
LRADAALTPAASDVPLLLKKLVSSKRVRACCACPTSAATCACCARASACAEGGAVRAGIGARSTDGGGGGAAAAAAASGTAQPLPQQQHVLGGEGAEYARRLRDEEAGVDAKAAAAAAAAAAAPLPPAPPSMPRAPPPAPAAPPSAQALARAQQAQVAALVGQAQQARTLRFDETSFFSSSSTMSDAAGISAASARKSPARAGAGKSVAEAVALAGSPSRFAATRSIDVW